MVFIYNLALIILSILLLPVILIVFVFVPKFRAGFWNKIGFYKSCAGRNNIVFHAVSVGEVNAIKELVFKYRNLHPDENIVITTTTLTGQNIAKKTFKDVAETVTYFPYDFFFSVNSFLNTYNPKKIIIAETEIWPCFIKLAKLKGIKIYIVNGRISPHSYDGYKKIKFFLSGILNSCEKIFMQTKDDAQRMVNIGADSDKVEVMGNLKYDISQNLTKEQIEKYQNELKTSKYRVFIVASTHKGEEEYILTSFTKLKLKYKDAKLLIAPRHPERYVEVSELLNKTEFNWGKRSNNDNFDEKDIILLDTMGELSKLFSISYVAYIGGSFSDTGGHNPLEATIWNKPVISGPCTFNFKDVYKIVTDKNCAVIVQNQEDLDTELLSFYEDENKYNLFRNNTNLVFDGNRGAIKYVLDRI